jgi:glutathione S-transferase
MSDLILHHYNMSPFAEKVRLILGHKGLAWQSVHIPPVLPKPDVVALTGGYRKTPFLQVGADVYCDTALIARVLEARQPTASLYPVTAPLAVPLA